MTAAVMTGHGGGDDDVTMPDTVFASLATVAP